MISKIKTKTKTKIKAKINFADALSFLIFLAIILCLIFPAKFSQATLDGAILFATKVLPTLFPFFVLSKLLIELGSIQKISKTFEKFTQKFFGTSGVSAYVFVCSILCGYPMGAKLVGDLNKQGTISKSEGLKILSFCSTSGPMFVLGTIAFSIFNNIKLGIIVLIAHILGAILNGILFKFVCKKNDKKTFLSKQVVFEKSKNPFISSVKSAMESILLVGAFVVLFCFLTELFLTVLPIKNQFIKSFLCSLIEITRGSVEIFNANLPKFLSAFLLAFSISFGGLSVHLQSMAFLDESGIKYRKFFMQKLCHAIISGVLVLPLTFLI